MSWGRTTSGGRAQADVAIAACEGPVAVDCALLSPGLVGGRGEGAGARGEGGGDRPATGRCPPGPPPPGPPPPLRPAARPHPSNAPHGVPLDTPTCGPFVMDGVFAPYLRAD